MTNAAEFCESQLTLQDSGLLKADAYINGEWCGAADSARFEVTNPATDAVIATLPDMGVAETREAIEAANAAWPAWRQKTGKERAGILRELFFLMMKNQEDLAQLITAEGGKPLAESRGEVAYGAAFIEWFGEEAKRTYGDLIPATFNDRRIVADKQPMSSTDEFEQSANGTIQFDVDGVLANGLLTVPDGVFRSAGNIVVNYLPGAKPQIGDTDTLVMSFAVSVFSTANVSATGLPAGAAIEGIRFDGFNWGVEVVPQLN